jgi:hypothetical protein
MICEKCFLEWGIDDVIGTAKEMKVKMTRKKAIDILDEMEKHHDAEYGVNWETIRDYISNS